MKEYLVEYSFNGSRWGFSVFAKDADEAERKLSAMKVTGHVVGERQTVIELALDALRRSVAKEE
ncbi:MAG: hypothetical protein QW318_07525 [Candidatus Caldarchaeum sp.]